MAVTPDLNDLAEALSLTAAVCETAVRHIADNGGIDANQVVAYDVAHASAAVETGRSLMDYAGKGEAEARLTAAFVADAVAEVAGRIYGREAEWGVTAGALDGARALVAPYRTSGFLADLAETEGPRHLGSDFEMVQDAFRAFAENEIAPIAEHIHRENGDIPEEIISGLAEMGAFGLSIPEEYGGFAQGGESDYIAMVVATEELARASLCVGGSLVTRPEILARALEAGGTEEQKQTWLPKLASAEVMNAVAVTEPDYGSDVAGITTTATPVEGGWLINGVKTWCTFGQRGDVLMVLARTNPDKSVAHKGISMFIVEKPRGDAHGFLFTQDDALRQGVEGTGKMEGRPIDTIGYRGMHSYEIAIEDWFVPAENQVGMEDGLGRGFYFQMAGFENGRLQTAARALGVMQAAYEDALQYSKDRSVFGKPVGDYQLTQAKLGKMAAIIQGSRQFSFEVAKLMAKGEGQKEASMVKAYVCKAAEWVTREAMQIHGGFGYAEEYSVSRYWVDARVLSIFEGADETLCLKVIARGLLREAAAT